MSTSMWNWTAAKSHSQRVRSCAVSLVVLVGLLASGCSSIHPPTVALPPELQTPQAGTDSRRLAQSLGVYCAHVQPFEGVTALRQFLNRTNDMAIVDPDGMTVRIQVREIVFPCLEMLTETTLLPSDGDQQVQVLFIATCAENGERTRFHFVRLKDEWIPAIQDRIDSWLDGYLKASHSD